MCLVINPKVSIQAENQPVDKRSIVKKWKIHSSDICPSKSFFVQQVLKAKFQITFGHLMFLKPIQKSFKWTIIGPEEYSLNQYILLSIFEITSLSFLHYRCTRVNFNFRRSRISLCSIESDHLTKYLIFHQFSLSKSRFSGRTWEPCL